MTKTEIRTTEHMAYLVPYNSELTIPYRAKEDIQELIRYIFSHPTIPSKQRKRFIRISQSGSKALVNDMAVRAIAMCEYYLSCPQQFGWSLDNILLQILIRMWRQTYKHMIYQSEVTEETEYLATPMKLLAINNGLWDKLIQTCKDKDYYPTNDSMVKVRKGIGLRDRKNNKKHNRASMKEGGKCFEYLCGLE